MHTLDQPCADTLARLALKGLQREYPNHLMHLLNGVITGVVRKVPENDVSVFAGSVFIVDLGKPDYMRAYAMRSILVSQRKTPQ